MVLQVQNLCKEYPQFSLRDISFQLPEGAIMGLIGENGAGKSTTMRMILGMAQPDSGQISVFGHRGVTPQDRESIGVVFDEMSFNQTLYTSHLGRVMKKVYSQWDESAYNQYLQRFSLPDKKEIKDFSRGMKMKLSLAIALSHDAQLLILDEPTSGWSAPRCWTSFWNLSPTANARFWCPRTSQAIWSGLPITSPSSTKAGC